MGIGSPEPLAWLTYRTGPFFSESYYVSRTSECKFTYCDLVGGGFPWQQECLTAMAEAAAKMHEAGIIHRDFSRGNILFRIREDGRADVELIDLNRLRFHSVSLEEGCRNFERLPMSEKADLRDAYPYGLNAVPNSEIVRIHASSGTTGKPIVVTYTQGDLDIWSETTARCFLMGGCSNEDITLIGHSGSGDADFSTAKKPTMKIVDVFHGKTGGGYLTQFYPPTGPITYLAITQDGDGNFKFIAAEGVNEEGKILNNGDTNMRTRFSISAREFTNKWCECGPTHHFAAGLGHHIDTLEKVAKIFNVPIEIVTR